MTCLARTLLFALVISVGACQGESEPEAYGVTLTWLPPGEFEDGRELPEDLLTEYRIYVDDYVVATVGADQTEYFLELPPGEWEVSISAVAGGMESTHVETTRVTIP